MSEGAGDRAESGLIRNRIDLLGGLAVVAVALFALWAAWDLPGMAGIMFGPGTAPRLFAVLLGLNGLAIIAMSFMGKGTRLPRLQWRGPVFLMASVTFFALAARPLGLVIATFCTFMLATRASGEMRLAEGLLIGALLTLACTLLFVTLLNLPFPVWPTLAGDGSTSEL